MFVTCGLMLTRMASDVQRPSIIILSTVWFIRNSDIAVPDLSDLVPMSAAWNPKFFSPPRIVHVVIMVCLLSRSLVICWNTREARIATLTCETLLAPGTIR